MIKTAAVYFLVVFGVGFLLGPFRILVLEPRVGTRAAELLEAPVMLLGILLAGRWVGRRWCHLLTPAARLGVGLITAGLILTADLAVGVGLRRMSVADVITGHDPVAGPVYYGLVALTTVAPWWFSRRAVVPQARHSEPRASANGGGS